MTNSAEPKAPPNGESGVEVRISTVVGDRLCVGCGFNLYGQPILREPRYQMHIVRCPECARIAALQEYPTLGKWAARWAALLAGVWFLVAAAWLFGSAGAIFGFSVSAVEDAADPLAQVIGEAHRAWQASQGPVQSQNFWGAWNWQPLDKDWWSAQDIRALYKDSGGLAGAFGAGVLAFWLGSWLALVPLGAFGSVLFLHVRRLRMALMAIPSIAIASCFALLWWIGAAGDVSRNLSGVTIARHYLGPTLMPLSIAFIAMPLAAGLVFGRPILRALARLLLPPRRRFALASLWTCDGLTPPTAGRSR
jgi:hypothetical protein